MSSGVEVKIPDFILNLAGFRGFVAEGSGVGRGVRVARGVPDKRGVPRGLATLQCNHPNYVSVVYRLQVPLLLRNPGAHLP